MNVYLSIKYHSNGENRERITKIMELLARHHMEPFCVALAGSVPNSAGENPQEWMREALVLVRQSKLMVVDLTEKGVGIGVEAGYAYGRGMPIVTIAQGGFEVSETLAGISQEVFYYQDWDDLDQFFERIERAFVPAGQAK
jgi:nucleoside 2-deoxyribosyltransferase